jgi:hypothetical protein
MEKKKKQLSLSNILIVCLIVLIPVVLGIIALYKLQGMQNKSSRGGVYSSKNNSPVTYNQDDVNKLHQFEQNRPKLSPSDAMAKVNLIKRENPLATTDDYTITYDPTTDIFQAEITTISINNAKDEVVQWFVNQGMSNEALCQLPLNFTLEDSVVQSLKGLDIIFNPLAPNC